MELKDMGYKSENPQPAEASKSKINYPSMSLHKNIPEDLLSKDIGSVCRLELEVKVVGKSIDQYSEDKDERIDLEILKIGYLSDVGGKTKDEYLNMSQDDRDEYDKKEVMSKSKEQPEK